VASIRMASRAVQNLWLAFSLDSYWTLAIPGIGICRARSGILTGQ
jgi:hypothetical protein